MSVRDCLDKLVAAGRLARPVAQRALDMHERMQREYSRTAPPAAADAAAALEAARTLKTQSADKIRNIHAQVTAFKDAETRLSEHPQGKRAGLMGMLTRDMWRDTGAFRALPDTSMVKSGGNVEGTARATMQWLMAKFASAEKLKPGLTGHTADQLTSIDNMLREIRGVDTGDRVAKTAATEFTAAANAGVARAKQGGKIFGTLEDWFTPQYWEGWRVKQISFNDFRNDILQAETRIGPQFIWNRDTNAPVTAADKDFVIKRAFDDITNVGGGQTAPFSKERRTFNFPAGQAGADEHIRLMKKYGWGNNPMMALVSHFDRMSKEIGLIETFGPQFEANFRALRREAVSAPEIPTAGLERWNPARMMAKFIESQGVVDGTWKVLTGGVHSAHDDAMSSWIGAMRNMNVASSLRQAIFAVLPTDSVTSLLAANHVGMSGFDHMANVFTGGVSKADAAHLNIQAHSAMDYINGIRDYENHISGLQATQKIAAGAVKATGLDWWGKMGKRTWAGDMLNLFASQAGNTFDKLEPNFQRLLSAYGFSPAEWDRLRAPAMQLDLNGARYLNPNVLMVTERPLYDRVMNAITEQGAFAMHQPDARLRSIETGLAYGATGRTQEFFRSFMQFKTFALSRMTTQLMRVFTDGPIENRIARGAAFVIASTAAGAAAMNAKQILNGKDPYDMHHPKQWLEAFAVGGAGGFYTDLINAAMRGEKSSGDMLTELAGPLASAGLDVARLAAAPLRERIEEHAPGHGTTTGRQLVSILRRNTPNTWYTRLAVDRIIYDKLQTLIDPDYRGSWRRMEDNVRKKGSGFWWGPGRNTPDRAPDLGNVWRQ